jgi:hypothetical protein
LGYEVLFLQVGFCFFLYNPGAYLSINLRRTALFLSKGKKLVQMNSNQMLGGGEDKKKIRYSVNGIN